jgi:non-specific serine/threonine protein kinase/serine/threonine-protein kinase
MKTGQHLRATPLPPAKGEGGAKFKRRLRGDLDNIVLKALRKEPALRYSSVEQFAEDIRRHLSGLPVTAMPDSIGYRVKKFLRRHQVGVAATALVVAALAGGVLATVREARIAESNRRRAEARFNDVRKLANSFLFEFDEAIKDLPGSTPARALVVRRALEYLDGLAAEARGDRSLQMEIASAYQKVAEVQGDPTVPNLGDSKGALESSRKSLAILETLRREQPGNQQVLLSLARNYQQISDVLAFSGDDAGMVEQSGEALKIYDSLAGSLARDPKFQKERVTQIYHYANQLQSADRLDEAATEYRRAVELSRQIVAANPSDQQGSVHLATSLDGLGNVLQEQGDTADALENRRKGLAIREELARLDPNNAQYRRQLAFSHHNVGLSLVIAGDLASALANFRAELSLFESLSAADPKDVQGRRNRSLAHKQIGDVLMRSGDAHGAMAQYRAALEIDRELTSIDPANSQAVLDLSFSEGKVGSALAKLGNTREALVVLRSGVSRQESLAAKDPNDVLIYNHLANSYTLLANCLLNSGDSKGAVGYYRKAVGARVTLTEKSPGSSSNRGALAACYTNLAKALGPGDRAGALRQFANAVELLQKLTANDPGNAQDRIALADALSNAARLYVRMAGEDAAPSTRLEEWTKAQLFYRRSQVLWQELDRSGKVPPSRSGVVREVGAELARCHDSLERLQAGH